ncbi:MAG: Fe-S cluster assembly ATPase SufC, partial [Solirubrobacteraceae bacterium]
AHAASRRLGSRRRAGRLTAFSSQPPKTGARISDMADLEIRDLHVRIEEREILRGVDLDISRGEIHALMGPNGSGKSTLASTLLGHPSYEITEGTIVFKGEDITEAEPHERAHAGLFLAFQYPVSIPGVSVANFLRMAINAQREEPIQVKEFRTQLQHAIDLLDVDRSFTSRHLNDGFSGGEKKRAEILQMAMLKPDIAILDETDSGLDIDALRTVAEGVQRLHDEQGLGALIITHYQRILHYVKPEFVHILMDGRIVLQGGVELVERLEREGYDQIRQEVGAGA